MSDKPILFSAPMIRSILSGSKTQTRRMLKPQPPRGDHYGRDIMDWGLSGIYQDDENTATSKWWLDVQTDVDDNSHREIDVRYAPGDRLWVRERAHIDANSVNYAASQHPELDISGLGYKPSIHMPRWASRLTLIVESVKVERLQDISAEDAAAEGVMAGRDGWSEKQAMEAFLRGVEASVETKEGTIPQRLFYLLWTSLHGREVWAKNPYVVAISFRVIKANIDSIGDHAHDTP